MKRKVLFILIIIIEMIIASFLASGFFWGILILNIIVTAGIIFIGKNINYEFN